jgi:PAS domain S-box-containing protein
MRKTDRVSNTGNRIYFLLIKQLYSQATIAIMATGVNATILVLVLHGLIDSRKLMIWYILTILVMIIRYILIKKFQQIADPTKEIHRWEKLMVIGIGISGILWGSTAIFLFPVQSSTHQAIIIIVLAGMVAGAVGVFSPIITVFLAFSIPALAPIFIRLMIIGDSLHMAMGVMTLLFAVLTFTTAKRINSSTRDLILLRLTFADKLEERTADLQKVNEQLRQEIEERRQAENTLKESEDRFRTLADNIAQFVWMADPKGLIFWYNKRWYDYSGTTLKEMAGSGWKKVHHPDHVDRVMQGIQRSLYNGEPWEDIMPLRGKEGEYRWFLSRALPIRDKEYNILRWFGTHTDITERLQAEEQIKKSLKEKTILLQEIHHRVKNNMQVINSLMNLQAAKIKDKEFKGYFNEAINRVNAIAMIHNILYNTNSVSKIFLKDYFERLIDNLNKIYDVSRINISIKTNPCCLGMNQAIPCGLIINELISNALKHAFPNHRIGNIQIDVFENNSGHLVMVVSDNGVGLPDDLDIYNNGTLGLNLVSRLAEHQLGGKFSVSRNQQGTSFRTEFLCQLCE